MILITASDHSTRDAILLLLTDRGYPARAIDCGDELFKYLRFQSIALIILDCDLKDSFEQLAKLRADARTHNLPIIMYSHTGTDVRTLALQKGASAFVAKGSLDWAEILTDVTRLIGPPMPK